LRRAFMNSFTQALRELYPFCTHNPLAQRA
jgi:hypothetical protein